jgi:ADP-ribose pyrophosphatase YjhB (NUDIX family)
MQCGEEKEERSLMEEGYIPYLRKLVGPQKVIMVAAGALVFNSQGELLLQQRTDTGLWDHPGGFKELEETVQETACREVEEETGLRPQTMTLFGIYCHQAEAPNGDQIDLVKILFSCYDYTGDLSCKDGGESAALAFFPLEQLPASLAVSMGQIVQDMQSSVPPPFLH